MSNISMVEAKLPPGFRFHPRDDELVCDYLMKKMTRTDHSPLLIEVDLNKCEPWDIPETAGVGGKEWYFYSQRDRKYTTGIRTNRATASGYWKATGKDRAVLRKGSTVGMRKTLVFYQGRAPRGRKSDWVMHEFRLHGLLAAKISSLMEDWVLCRVFHKEREAVTRANLGSCYDPDDTGSSSLPALMDPHIQLDQTQPNLDQEHDGQVPCLSIFSNNQTSHPIFPHITQLLEPRDHFGQITMIPTPLDPLSCDKEVLKSVLNQLTRMENKPGFEESPPPPSLGEGSLESYLSDVAGMPDLWNNP